MAKRFYLYQRQRPAKPPVWYVKFRDENNVIGSPICSNLSDREKAEQWAIERLAQRDIPRKGGIPTFEQWCIPWWIPGTCPYIAEKKANGFSITPKYAALRRAYLKNYLLPQFGHYLLSELKPRMFRDFKMELYQKGEIKPATVNCILGTARIMFNYAVEMGELETNPVSPVKELKEHPAERGILNMDELKALFALDSLSTIWKDDLRHYGLNLLAASTGMRLGECQGLQIKYVYPQYINVVHGWDDRYGISPPKWNSVRIVPIPQKTSTALTSLINSHRWGEPQPEDIVFWGVDRNTPLSKTGILRTFKIALKRIGIEEEERRRRVLVFHSYRHGFNSMIRGKVPDEQLRRVTGHKTLAMSDTYDHVAIEHLSDVKETQERLFG